MLFVLIMNITISVSSNIYFSVRQILPTTIMDFDFMRAKIINCLVDSFEKIKSYNPKDVAMPLTVEQVQEVQANGFTIIKMPDGSEKRITQEDILIKKSEADKIKEAVKKDALYAGGSRKIIVPGSAALQ